MIMLPSWNPSKKDNTKSIVLPFIVLVIVLLFWMMSLFSIFNGSRSLLSSINFIFFACFFIYLLGRIYGELLSDRDFININSEGITYRETPSFQLGWLPINKFLTFDMIKSTDMVSARKMFHPNEDIYGIVLYLHQGKSKLIGTRLKQKQLMEIAFALKGSVMLTGSLKRLLGEDVTLKDVINTAKGIWNSFRQNIGEEYYS